MIKKPKIKLFILLIIILSFFAILQVILLNKYSTTGEQISSLNTDIEDIKKVNSKIRMEIASVSAMASIAYRAQYSGLNKSSSFVSLKTPLPVAYDLQLSF